MPQVEVVTGGPFAGKSLYIASEIARREGEGELGLVALDFTGLYSAVVPGVESSLRDRSVSDTGAPRLVGYLFNAAVAQIAVRELSGYVATNSPTRAVGLAERFGGRLVNVEVSADVLAGRIESHMRGLDRTVKRATREGIVGRCRDAAGRYLRETPALIGKARNVVKDGKRWRDSGPVLAFDRALYEKGLTAAGRDARDLLVAEGFTDWRPADILSVVLRATGRR